MNPILKAIKQALCEHEFRTLYLDYKFHVEREEPVRYWVCRCRKCEKIMRVESRRAVL
jgi:RNase P subunit RPR2